MIRRASSGFRASQRGLGLVELMVGITLGLIILILLSYFFLGSRQTSRTSDDISRMQESGRQAIDILGAVIRQAGARTNLGAPPDPAFVGVALANTQGAGTSPDAIQIQYEAQRSGETDCAGTSYAEGALVTVALVLDAANRVLACGVQPAVENVENMQFVYGLDANRDGIIESYTNNPANMNEVAAVRVSLLVRGPTPSAAIGNQTVRFNGANVTFNDGFLRQVYTATFTVRNQAG